MKPAEKYFVTEKSKAILPMNNTQRGRFWITTFTGQQYCVDWGDGTVRTYNSGQEAVYDYQSNFTGNIKIWARSGSLSTIKQVRLSDSGKANVDGITGNNRISSYNISPSFLFQFPKIQIFEFDQYLYGASGGTGSGNVTCNTLFTGDWSQFPKTLVSLLLNNTDFNGNTAVFNADNLPANISEYALKELRIGMYAVQRNVSITGSLNNLPKSIESLEITGTYNNSVNNYSVNVETLSNSLKKLNLTHSSTFITAISAKLDGLVNNNPDLTYLNLTENNSYKLSGDIKCMENRSFTYFCVNSSNTVDSNTITGDILYLKNNPITFFILGGNNYIYGDIKYIPSTAKTFKVSGQNALSNSIENLNPLLAELVIQGKNTIDGSIDKLARTDGWNSFNITGDNEISGTAPYLRPAMFIAGKNTISGNVEDIPPYTVGNINIYGNTSLGGNLHLFKGSYLTIDSKSSTINCDVGLINNTNMPNAVAITIGAGNTGNITGDIGSYAHTKMVTFNIFCQNTVYGDLGKTPQTPKEIYFGNGNNIGYTTRKLWGDTMNKLYLTSNSSNMDSTMVNNLLIDLSKVTTWGGGGKRIDLKGSIAPRSTTDANVTNAVNIITSKGVIVNTN